jgi:hypothetical protein
LVTAGRQQITREWWEETRNQFDTYISVLVLEEAKGGDRSAAEKRLKALAGIPVLKINDMVEELAGGLIRNGPIPEECSEDALHIAIATINGMDFFLTWNFNHINNAQMKSEIIRIIEEYGYECPIICSPEELMGG